MPHGLQEWLPALPFAVLALNADGQIIGANPAADALLGPGLLHQPLLAATRHPDLLAAIDAVYAGAKTKHLHITLTGLTGEVNLEVTVAASAGNTRDAPMVLLTFMDVTEKQHADQMRRDFVANVSHELKTPLTSILGFLEVLRGPAKDDKPKLERFLSVMETEALRMNRLVHDLLSLSRVEAEERQRPKLDVDIAALGQSVVLSLTPMAETNGIELSVDCSHAELGINGDEGQLRQMLVNIIENAVKYSGDDGEVTLSIKYLPKLATLRGPAVEIIVSDNGPGIAETHIPRLTERFYRVDTHRSREQGGTGLGLAIVKHVINRHGGLLRIQSEVGVGSRFCVYLPAPNIATTPVSAMAGQK